MADNVTLSAGDNPTIDLATDEIASVHYQKVKLIDPTDNSTAGIGTAANPMHMQSATLPLPSGAATAANQTTIISHVDGIESALTTLNAKDFATQTTLAAINTKVTACDTGAVTIVSLPNEGQQTMANSISVAVASNQSAIPINDNGGSITVDGAVSVSGTINVGNISGTVNLPTGAATAANQLPDGHNVTVDNGSGGSAVNIQDGGNTITVDGAVTANQGTAVGSGAGWRIQFVGPSGLPTVNFNIAGIYEVPAVVIGDPVTGSPWNFISGRGLVQQKSTLNGRITVSGSTSNQTLLAAQSLRCGATIFNNSTATLYIKYAATASLSSWDHKLFPNQYHEVPFGTDAQIDGIWDAATGDAHVTEFY